MKVRCIKLLDSRGLAAGRSAWVKIGSIYHVLSIWIEPGRSKLRLIGEEVTPALFELEMFEVVSSRIPPTWVAASPKPGCLAFAPVEWSAPGFWESFFDGDPEAVSSFEQARAKIVACDP